MAETIKDEVVREIVALNQDDKNAGSIRPNLAIILVGERKDSKLYVEMKEKEAKKVGIDTHVYKCEVDTPEREVFDMIDCLNKDDLIDAILVQLPLPAGFDTDGIILAIDPKKDVDRFHPDNFTELMQSCDHTHVIPPLFSAVLKMLESIKCGLDNKTVCVVANADIFSQGLKKVLECRRARVQTARPDDPGLKDKTKAADILVIAAGRANFITQKMIKEGAVIIDIGINQVDGHICGDVDYKDCEEKAGYITPVPGGVGPMTIALLFKNTLELYKARHKNN